MTKNRSADRHKPDRVTVIWRPTPPELRDRLDAAVGKGKRGETLDLLVAAYLNGDPMPALPSTTQPPG